MSEHGRWFPFYKRPAIFQYSQGGGFCSPYTWRSQKSSWAARWERQSWVVLGCPVQAHPAAFLCYVLAGKGWPKLPVIQFWKQWHWKQLHELLSAGPSIATLPSLSHQHHQKCIKPQQQGQTQVYLPPAPWAVGAPGGTHSSQDEWEQCCLAQQVTTDVWKTNLFWSRGKTSLFLRDWSAGTNRVISWTSTREATNSKLEGVSLLRLETN